MLDERGKSKNTATISATIFRYYFGLKKLWAKVEFFGVEMLAENGSGDGQVLPWTAPVGQFGSANLCKRMALEYADSEP